MLLLLFEETGKSGYAVNLPKLSGLGIHEYPTYLSPITHPPPHTRSLVPRNGAVPRSKKFQYELWGASQGSGGQRSGGGAKRFVT